MYPRMGAIIGDLPELQGLKQLYTNSSSMVLGVSKYDFKRRYIAAECSCPTCMVPRDRLQRAARRVQHVDELLACGEEMRNAREVLDVRVTSTS